MARNMTRNSITPGYRPCVARRRPQREKKEERKGEGGKESVAKESKKKGREVILIELFVGFHAASVAVEKGKKEGGEKGEFYPQSRTQLFEISLRKYGRSERKRGKEKGGEKKRQLLIVRERDGACNKERKRTAITAASHYSIQARKEEKKLPRSSRAQEEETLTPP